MVRLENVKDLETAKQMAALLEAENARLHQRLELLVQENARLKGEDAQARLQLELTQLKEQLALLQQRLFGASSEKRPPVTEATPPTGTRPQRGHGPRAQPELPVQEVMLPLDEADKVCGLCGGALKEWTGQTEDSQEVSVVERHFVLKRHRRQKYRCPCGCAPVTAPAPPRLMEGSRYSVDFAVHVALQKYGFHLPLARQVRMFEREGLVVDSQTLWDQLSALAHHLQPSYEALPAAVFASPLIHADETHWYMLDKGPGKKWYAWTVACAEAVYHRILPSRSGATAKQVLGSYKGIVMVDGYAAYQTATKSSADGAASCSLVFCWAHVRRKFVEAEQVAPSCTEVLSLMGQLYAIEADLPDPHAMEGKQQDAALAQRLAVRQEKSAPLVTAIREWALAQRSLPGSALRKAIEYMLGLWSGLTVFLSNPWVPLGRVEHWRGGRKEWGVAVADRFRVLPIGASVPSTAPFPVPAHRTGRAALPHPALT